MKQSASGSSMSHRDSRALRGMHFASIVSVFFVLLIAASAQGGETVSYTYDALGRLVQTSIDDGINDGLQTNIAYDPAGNRSSYASATMVTLPPGVPASISVPSSNSTGSYTISWGSSTGTVTAYQLYEATNSSFSGQVQAYSGAGTSKAISGKGNGTYYYRVRACNGSACSGYRTGANATTVTLTPGVPASISVPSSSTTGSYTISWGSSTGTVTAYQLYEATNSSFSGQVQVYSGTGTSKAISGKGNGTYYYRVRACNGSGCSGYRTGANATTVTLPPSPPSSISGPGLSTNGFYSISWSSSAGATRYELWESKDLGSFLKVYDGSSTSKSFTSKSDGEYSYKAKACNAAGCSGFSPVHLVQVCKIGCALR